jgi:hypothetical protein
MSAKYKFNPESYFRSFSPAVSPAEVRRFIRRSPDHHHFKWDYLNSLVRPLELGQLPESNLSDLNFALGNLLIQLDDEGSLKPLSRLYLASLYLYVTQVHPGGSQLQDTAVRVALDSLIGNDDQERLELFTEFLSWLLNPKVAHRDAENFFVRLGVLIARTQLSIVKPSEFRMIKSHLPSWIRGVQEVRLLSSDPKFSQSWRRLLGKIESRERIEALLGLS